MLKYVCLQFYTIRSFNLGDGTLTLESDETQLNEWQMVEVRRNGRQGVLVVNGETYGPVILKKTFLLYL